MKMHVRKNDKVVVISGNDKPKNGKIEVREVLEVNPKTKRVVVKGANMVTKHQKQTNATTKAGIVTMEAAIDASNVQLYCEKCKKPVRVGYKFDENGAKIRVCRKCGETI